MDPFVNDMPQHLANLYLEDNEEILLKLVLQRWNKKKESLNLGDDMKSAERAAEMINKGNKLYASSSSLVHSLLTIYTQAIATAPNNSLELARAYGNRSAVLSNGRLYEDSLIDIDRAVGLNYPDNLKAKLYVRKAGVLTALSPEKRLEIKEAVAVARRFMAKISDADKSLLESKLNELRTLKSLPKLFKQPDGRLIAPDILDANEKLADASSAIELKYSEQLGRHFVATRDIKAGETLITQRAYASVIGTNVPSYAYCWNCAKRTNSSIPCEHCVSATFCHEKCRTEAWKSFHDIECQILKCMLSVKISDIERMALRLTIKAFKEAGSVKALQEMLENIDSISDPIARYFTGEVLDSTKYAGIYTATTDLSCKFDTKLVVRRVWITAFMIFSWAHISEIFGKVMDNMSELIDNESAIFMGKLIIKNIKICEFNSLEVETCIYKEEQPFDYGIMISCLTSYINHSCDPNSCLAHIGDIMVIKSIQMIKEGEQICISYFQNHDDVDSKKKRQDFLQKRFNFKCECLACRKDWDLSNIPCPTFKDQPLREEIKSLLSKKCADYCNVFRKNLDSPEQLIQNILRKDSSYISIVVDLLNNLGQFACYPCLDIWANKNLLRKIYIYNSQ